MIEHFPVHQEIQNLDFGILILGYISKFFPIHKEIKNWDFGILILGGISKFFPNS